MVVSRFVRGSFARRSTAKGATLTDVDGRSARIVVVADAYDALTSWRPYRDPLARDAALDEIQRSCHRGIYDPRVVEALLKLLG